MVTKISSIQNSKTSSVEYTRMIPDWVAMKTKPPYLAHNQNGSLVRLSNLLSKLQHDPALSKEYDDKTEEQLCEGIVEEAPATTTRKEFYITHKPVVK